MSQYPRAPGRPDRPGVPSGSVGAARERMERGEYDSRRAPGNPSPQRQNNSPPRAVPISRPAPMPQWPLPNDIPPSSPQSSQPVVGKSPPRRPPRPSYVPSILDASRIQDHTPAFQYRQQQAQATNQYPSDRPQQRYWDPNYVGSPQEASTPGSGFSGNSASSRPLTTSSYGSIPDFPVPTVPAAEQAPTPQTFQPSPQHQPQIQSQLQVQPQMRRSIGPPPSARRGASSYYSHSSFVTPIPEEVPESPRVVRGQRGPQHGSYASSHVIPQSWADGPPGYYTGPYEEDEEDEYDDGEGRGSRASDHDESSNLVRKASLGKQFKPTLTTVRSSSSSGSDEFKNGPVPKVPAIVNTRAIGAEVAESAMQTNMTDGNARHLGPIDTNVADGSSTSRSTGPSPLSPESNQSDPVKQIMGGLERGGAIERGVTPPVVAPQPRRPPRLDIDAVHEAEARGSLTSLTDLIRRATRARSNLEKGRTASRLGMLDFGSSSNPNLLLEKMRSPNHKRNSDSLSGILASFPPPALTPQGERPGSSWPSPFTNSNLNVATGSEQKGGNGAKRRGRRCCGLPLWVFLVLLLLLVLFIAAAVTLPIVLIVLPRMRDQKNATDLTKCGTTHPCQNGGHSVVVSDSCSCICTKGFTGSSCTTPDSDCTSSTAGSIKDATMGKSIPRLLSTAKEFSISFNTTELFSTFAAANVSCMSEEALVTFNDKTQRRAILEPRKAAPASASVTAPSFLANAAASAAPSAVTSNGIILDSPLPTAQTVSGTAAPSATATAAPSSSTSSKHDSPSTKDLDFARVAVLWILQQTQQLNTAVNVQSTLKDKLSGSFTAEAVDLGSGIKVDFLRYSVTANGTTTGS